jgi:hypothetical protein
MVENSWKIYAFTEGLVFIFILVMGLAYLWKNNLLDWQFNAVPKEDKKLNISENSLLTQQRINEKSTTKKENTKIIPNSLYQQINTRYT